MLQLISLFHASEPDRPWHERLRAGRRNCPTLLGHYSSACFVLVTKHTLLCFSWVVFNLPCAFLHATQWEHHIKTFCEDDTSVKDRIYQCCRKQGSERLDCFHNDAPNPSYNPTEELPVAPVAAATEFSFEPSTCWR